MSDLYDNPATFESKEQFDQFIETLCEQEVVQEAQPKSVANIVVIDIELLDDELALLHSAAPYCKHRIVPHDVYRWVDTSDIEWGRVGYTVDYHTLARDLLAYEISEELAR